MRAIDPTFNYDRLRVHEWVKEDNRKDRRIIPKKHPREAKGIIEANPVAQLQTPETGSTRDYSAAVDSQEEGADHNESRRDRGGQTNLSIQQHSDLHNSEFTNRGMVNPGRRCWMNSVSIGQQHAYVALLNLPCRYYSYCSNVLLSQIFFVRRSKAAKYCWLWKVYTGALYGFLQGWHWIRMTSSMLYSVQTNSKVWR